MHAEWLNASEAAQETRTAENLHEPPEEVQCPHATKGKATTKVARWRGAPEADTIMEGGKVTQVDQVMGMMKQVMGQLGALTSKVQELEHRATSSASDADMSTAGWQQIPVDKKGGVNGQDEDLPSKSSAH